MGAGISNNAMNSRIRRRLQKIQNQLGVAGVKSVYRNYQLVRFEDLNDLAIGGFNITFNVLRASNGESASFIHIIIRHTLQGDFSFGGTKEVNGSFDDGIKKLIEIFAEVR